jgi:hypothetical protein
MSLLQDRREGRTTRASDDRCGSKSGERIEIGRTDRNRENGSSRELPQREPFIAWIVAIYRRFDFKMEDRDARECSIRSRDHAQPRLTAWGDRIMMPAVSIRLKSLNRHATSRSAIFLQSVCRFLDPIGSQVVRSPIDDQNLHVAISIGNTRFF